MARIFLLLFCVPFTQATNNWPTESDGTVIIPSYFNYSIPGDFINTLKCGGVISKPGWVRSNGFRECAFHVKAPVCHKVEIKIMAAYLPSKSCETNFLNLLLSEKKYENHYCRQSDVPIDKAMYSEGPDAAIYYKIPEQSYPGMTATVDFVPETNQYDASSTIRQSSVSEYISLSGPCTIQEIEDKKYVYSTPNYLSPVDCFAHCGMSFDKEEGYKLTVYKVMIENERYVNDTIEIREPLAIHWLKRQKFHTIYVLLPASLKLLSTVHPGEGFRVTWQPAVDLPYPCNGRVIQLTTRPQMTLKNPWKNFEGVGAKCIFSVVTLPGKRIRCSFPGGYTVQIHVRGTENRKFTQAEEKSYTSEKEILDLILEPYDISKDWVIECSRE